VQFSELARINHGADVVGQSVHHHFICPMIQQCTHVIDTTKKSRTNRSGLNINNCPFICLMKQLHEYNYTAATQAKYYKQTGPLEKSNFSILFLKALRREIFSKWQCIADIYNFVGEKLLYKAECTLRLRQLVIMTPCISEFKDITKVNIY